MEPLNNPAPGRVSRRHDNELALNQVIQRPLIFNQDRPTTLDD